MDLKKVRNLLSETPIIYETIGLLKHLGPLPQNFAVDNLFVPRSTVEVLVMTKREKFSEER